MANLFLDAGSNSGWNASGMVKAEIDEEVQQQRPDISVEAVQYKPPHSMVGVVCQNQIMVISLATTPVNSSTGSNVPRVIRLNLTDPDETYEIVCHKDSVDIKGTFLDPTGNHLIIALSNGENVYLHKSWTKPKPLKFQGRITAVGWDTQLLDYDSQLSPHNLPLFLLLGTDKGEVYATALERATFTEGTPIVSARFSLVYTLEPSVSTNVQSISSITVSHFTHQANKFYIVLTTSDHLYQFIGKDSMEKVFEEYSDENTPRRIFPGAESKFRISDSVGGYPPPSYGWLTGSGLVYGPLTYANQQPRSETVMASVTMLPYPAETVDSVTLIKSDTGISRVEIPKSFLLTDYHVLLMYADKLIALNKLNVENLMKKNKGNPTGEQIKETIVWDFNIKGYPLIDFAYDPVAGIFLFSKNRIYELKIRDETSYLWQIHLKLGNYDDAEKYTTDPVNREYIDTKRSEHLMASKEYTKAAVYFARSKKKKFEEAVLQFIHLNQHEALIAYLQEKLPMLRYQDATQRTILATWLLELYLKKLDDIENNEVAATGDYLKKLVAEKQTTVKTIQTFLKSNKDSLEQKSTFRLLSASGRSELLFFYSAIIKDFEKLLSHFLDQRWWKEALLILQQQNNAEPIYKHAPVLMANVPVQTVEVLIKAGNILQAEKLIPALMRCDYSKVDPTVDDPVIKYLEFAVQKGCKDPSVHNLLLSLYMKKPDEGPLSAFLQQPDTHFGLDFALQLSFIHRKKRAVALVYAKMGLFEEAMNIALSLGIELAKIIANKPMDDKELRKFLWLSVVRHLMEEKKDIKGAMEVFQQCKVLGIDDVIRFLPDHMKIQDFSDEICQSLDESNKRVAQLKSKMTKATESAEIIRSDIKKLQEKVISVNEEQVCVLTHLPIKKRPFYLFADGSCFLKSALIDEVKSLLPSVEIDRVNFILGEIQKIQQRSSLPSPTELRQLQELEEELTSIIASENIFYSTNFISSVSRPFLTDDETEELSWKL